MKIGHNFKFDLMWMIDAYPPELGVLMFARNLHDTMLKSQLVNRYRTRTGVKNAGLRMDEHWLPNDLATVLHRWLGVVIDKAIDHTVTDWTGEWSSDMEDYMLEDIVHLTKLNTILDREIIKQGQEQASWIEMNTVFGAAWMTYNGFKPDVDAWRLAAKQWQKDHDHLIWHLKKFFPTVKNFNSTPQLMAAMPSVIGAPLQNIKKATINQLTDSYPALAVLEDERMLSTRLKNWGPDKYDEKGRLKERGYLERYVCKVCRRFHPEWRQIGTETSRFSCSGPNLQQIPRAKEFRRLFIADEGCVLASLDYSAIEVLVAAIFAEEKRLIQACATGDPHMETAAMVAGHEVTKESPERQAAKISNFGLLFGGGAVGLVKQARDNFKTDITIQQAEAMIATYFRLYPRLRVTKNMAYNAMKIPGPVEVHNFIGFRRILEGYNRKPTSWLNTIIQSTAGYGLKASFRYLMEACLLPFLIAQVHDELIFEFPEEDALELTAIAKACMIKGMRDVIGARAPVIVDDSAVGKVWL